MFGTNSLQMPDHGATFGNHDGTPASINDGLRYFQRATLNTATHKRWQYLSDHRPLLVAAVRFHKRLDLVAGVH